MAENVVFLLICSALVYSCQAKGLFESSPHIEHLDQENFEKKVLKSERAWLIEFYDSKNVASKESVPEIEKLARILAGIAKIGVVDASANEKLAHNYDAKETPTIILFGADKEKPTLYKDKVQSAILIKKVGAHVKALIRHREEKAESNPKKDVVKLTEENFQKKVLDSDSIWFVKYYDPNCAHSKSFAPEYAKAAAALKGTIYVGAVNMDVEIYEKMGEPYNIEKVPMVKIFGVDKINPPEFTGARKSKELVDRALDEMEKLVKKRLSAERKTEDVYGEGPEDSEEDDKSKKEELTDATKIKKDKKEKKEEKEDLPRKKEKKEDKKKDEKKKDEKKEEKKEKESKKEKKEKKEKNDKKEKKEEL